MNQDFINKDKFAKFIGVKVLEASSERAQACLTIEDKHLNGIDTAQGGSIFTLADYAFAIVSNIDGGVVTSININISYVKAVKKGDTITATATPRHTNTKIPIYDVAVTNQNNELVAIFQGMGYRLSPR